MATTAVASGCDCITNTQTTRFPEVSRFYRQVYSLVIHPFSALTRLGGRKGIRPVKTEWWGAGMVICLEQGADLHIAQLMPLPLTVSCFSKIQISLTFLVRAHPGSPGKRAVKRVYVYSQVINRMRVTRQSIQSQS